MSGSVIVLAAVATALVVAGGAVIVGTATGVLRIEVTLVIPRIGLWKAVTSTSRSGSGSVRTDSKSAAGQGDALTAQQTSGRLLPKLRRALPKSSKPKESANGRIGRHRRREGQNARSGVVGRAAVPRSNASRTF